MENRNDNILRHWIKSNGYSLREIAGILNMNESNFSKILSGTRNANPIISERILRLTQGAVQPNDLHRIRINWLQDNKPDVRFELEDFVSLKQHNDARRGLHG